jgi:opacity protein-like surface antigen
MDISTFNPSYEEVEMMKRIIRLFVLMGVLMVPSVGFAETGRHIYTAEISPHVYTAEMIQAMSPAEAAPPVDDVGKTPSVRPAGQVGVYVAPKLLYGHSTMKFIIKDYNSDTGEVRTERLGNKSDNTWGGALAIGYDFSKQFDVPIRSELEYSIFSNVKAKDDRFAPTDPDWREITTQTFGIQTLFMNAYWDINTGTPFTPYIGAGLGMAFVGTKYTGLAFDVNDPESAWVSHDVGKKTRTNFAWNIGAGLGYDINEYLTLDLGYRFASLGSVKSGRELQIEDGVQSTNIWDYADSKNLRMHQVMAGLRFTF